MNSIFGIGPLELFFIAIIALVILGPERLPGVIREGMKYYRTLRNMSGDLTSQFSEELKALDEINPQKIMNEMMQDLDMEEERNVLADLNPKKIRKDISDSVNPKKILTKKPAADKAVEKADTTTAAATTGAVAVAATEDKPAETESVQPAAEDTGASDNNLAEEVRDGAIDAAVNTVAEDEVAPAFLTTAEILARSQPKMSGNPYTKSSKKTSAADATPLEPPASSSSADVKPSDLDEPMVENRIAPDELAANIDSAEASDQADPAIVAANGTHNETHEGVEDGA